MYTVGAISLYKIQLVDEGFCLHPFEINNVCLKTHRALYMNKTFILTTIDITTVQCSYTTCSIIVALVQGQSSLTIRKNDNNYRLITAYLLLRVNLDKIMHAR